jgi:hypothetical protein
MRGSEGEAGRGPSKNENVLCNPLSPARFLRQHALSAPGRPSLVRCFPSAMLSLQNPLQATGVAELHLVDLGINLLIGLVLSHVLGWHYVRFGQVLGNKAKMARVLVFISATTLLIISVVKVSLALSLGLVGALSIIRFRTPIKEPEELAYLFLAIALGVGLGADRRYETALVFVVVLAVMALRSGLAAGLVPLRTVLEVAAPAPAGAAPLPVLLPAVSRHCQHVDLRRVDCHGERFEASLFVELRDTSQLQALIDDVRKAVPGADVSLVERDHLE